MEELTNAYSYAYSLHQEEKYSNCLIPSERLLGSATDHLPSRQEGPTPAPDLQEESADLDQGLVLHLPGHLHLEFHLTGLPLEVQLLHLLGKLILLLCIFSEYKNC